MGQISNAATSPQEFVTVYRVEDAFGIGVLSCSGLTDAMNVAMTGDRKADWHGDRGLPAYHSVFGNQPGLVCGVDNPRDLVRWFPSAMRRVIARSEYGLTIYRMPADAVLTAKDAMQVMFDPNLAASSEQVGFGGAPPKTFEWLDRVM